MKSLPMNPDAIVIGSGMGGLAFAACMAKLARWRVLVLERHFKIGGFTQTFRRPGGWEWNVGLHYVGGMAPASTGRRLFDFLTNRGVSWSPMPDVYDRFIYPNTSFGVPRGEARFQETLIGRFPSERAAIEQYFRDLRSAESWFRRYAMAKALPPTLRAGIGLVNRVTGRLPLMTTGSTWKRASMTRPCERFSRLNGEILAFLLPRALS